MSYKPEVRVFGEEPWHQNGLAFATKKEAEQSAYDLMMRWTLVRKYRAVESDQPVNAKWENGHCVMVKEA